MTPLAEEGAVFCFSTESLTWSRLSPSSGTHPCPRSYHCSTASPGGIYIHAGCGDASTGRLRDFWWFDLTDKQWTQLEDAPGDPRGGAAIAWSKSTVWRFGGFNGKNEIGGAIDNLKIVNDGRQTASWETVSFSSLAGQHPEARSVCSLEAADGKLILLFGEGNPSPTGGHDSAGNFWSDAWTLDLVSGIWVELESGETRPEERGWFASSFWKGHLYLWGGIDSKNDRLGDGWKMALA